MYLDFLSTPFLTHAPTPATLARQTSTKRAMDDLHGVASTVLQTDTSNYDHEHTHLMHEVRVGG